MEVVLYARTSTVEQETDNQILALREYCKNAGHTITDEYIDRGASGGNGDRKEFLRMLSDADKRKFKLLLVWGLDRISREGISNTLGYLNRLKRNGIAIKSLKESWLDTTDDGIGEVVIAVMAWVAQQERKRIIERTHAGLDRARTQGKTLGRPKGAKDKKRRKRAGYLLRWVNNPPSKNKRKEAQKSKGFIMAGAK
jgi:DNA invertase Pin-like site-specific DNA recombinase